jgi:8-oxo-dGTP pyrophosphatase MutT (NUDIX family)
MYKVFIENKPVIFTTHTNEEDLSVLRTEKFADVARLIRDMSVVPKEGIAIECKDPEQLFRKTFCDYEKIEAAGGVVVNKGALLLIHRLGMWDFPKGKLEKGEKPEEASVREIEEECGIQGHKIICPLSDTWHTYPWKGRQVLKRTFWYAMSYDGNDQLVPQTEEDIEEVRWVLLQELDYFRAQMYPSLLPVLNETVVLMKNGTVFENRSAE